MVFRVASGRRCRSEVKSYWSCVLSCSVCLCVFPDSFESVGVIYLCHSQSELDFSNIPKIEVWDSGQVFPVMEDRKAGL